MKRLYTFLMNIALRVYIALYGAPIKVPFSALRDIPKKSILVFSNTALGDTLMSTPTLVGLRKSFPEAHITLFIAKNMYPLFEGAEYVDTFIIYHGGYKKFFSTVMQLRHVKADVALLLHSNGPQDIPMAVFSGAPVILKHPTNSVYKKYLTALFEKKKQHTIEDRNDIVKAIGGNDITTRMCLPKRYMNIESTAKNNSLTIGFQVGASGLYKTWPKENFLTLADLLLARYEKATIIITGIKKEQKIADFILRNSAFRERIRSCCGEFSIEKLPFLVRSFDLLVTNDTGTMHVAIALGVPTVEIFGATTSAETGAYQDMSIHHIIQKHDETLLKEIEKHRKDTSLISRVPVDEVFESAIALLP